MLDHLKFRGMKNGKMYYGRLTILEIDFKEVKAGCYISNQYGTAFAHKVEPETICRPTGLRNDINGKKPFEKDIVKYYLDSGIEGDDTQTEYIEPIEWVGTGFELDGVPLTILEDWPFEIIGNLIENPELVEK